LETDVVATHLLTVQLTKEGQEVQVHCNREGLLKLTETLNRLARHTRQEHIHLMTEDWGGGELTAEPASDDGMLVNLMTIYYWPD
jgi:hypothetical protein